MNATIAFQTNENILLVVVIKSHIGIIGDFLPVWHLLDGRDL